MDKLGLGRRRQMTDREDDVTDGRMGVAVRKAIAVGEVGRGGSAASG